MKVSIRTVNRVWGHWMKTKEPLAPRKFGRPKTSMSEADKRPILELEIMLITSKSFDAVSVQSRKSLTLFK